MNLENKVNNNKPGFFKGIARRAMPYILAAGLGLSIIGCQDPQPIPGPIYVQNTLNPTTILSGSDIYWEVKVANQGEEVTIEQVIAHEKVISGWSEGDEYSENLLVTNKKIDANSEEIIFSRSGTYYNRGPSNIIIENTVTVYSDGCDNSDTCTYTVLSTN